MSQHWSYLWQCSDTVSWTDRAYLSRKAAMVSKGETADLPWADFTFYLKKRKQWGEKYVETRQTEEGQQLWSLHVTQQPALQPISWAGSRKLTLLAEGGGKEQLQAKRTVKYGLHLKWSWQIQEKLSNALLARSIKSQTFRDFSCTENCITISYKKTVYFRENETEKALSTKFNLFKEGKK